MKQVDVLVIGGGIAGMTAAALLGHAGRSVRLLEAGAELGGKAGRIVVDGAELDTGPSVLTLPEVLLSIAERVGVPEEERFELLELSPGFEYRFAGGGRVVTHHHLEDTLASVESSLGNSARRELESYLAYAKKIWEAAAPHFVFERAPSVSRLFSAGLSALGAVAQIDPFRTLRGAIASRVKTPELRCILSRYATYNGSDVRSAPATLGCIAHVELTLGGYGVRGGMRSVVRTLTAALRRGGVEVSLDDPVTELTWEGRRATGAVSSAGRHSARDVVLAADPWQWFPEGGKLRLPASNQPLSMSAHNALFRARRLPAQVAPHTVIFPADYEREFRDIFDERSLPRDPTLYVCALDRCHGMQSFPHDEPLFTMVNAPALEARSRPGDARATAELVRAKLEHEQLLGSEDSLLWTRSPEDLARQFPGSQGALYGPASNSTTSAFQRLPNQVPGFEHLFLASGSAHPGGGVPLAAQSGKLAAELILECS